MRTTGLESVEQLQNLSDENLDHYLALFFSLLAPHQDARYVFCLEAKWSEIFWPINCWMPSRTTAGSPHTDAISSNFLKTLYFDTIEPVYYPCDPKIVADVDKVVVVQRSFM